MSEIRKIPYIESFIASLSDANKTNLLNAVNGTGSSIQASLDNIPVADIQPVIWNFEKGQRKNAIYVKSGAKALLLCYHRFQDLQLYEIDTTNKTIKEIEVYLSIEELRRILTTGSGGGEITPESLAGVLEGSETVVVDLNEEEDKLQVRLDQDVINKLDKALVTPTTAPTDDTLVGVGTGREQIQVYIGDGLELANDTSPFIMNVVTETWTFTLDDDTTVTKEVASWTSQE